MSHSFRSVYVVSTLVAVLAVVGAAPAVARTHHAHHRHGHHRSGINDTTATSQRHLINLGYYRGTADGVMGTETRDAVRHFQRDSGLKVDGVVGPRTRRALEEADRLNRHSENAAPVYGSKSIPLLPTYDAYAGSIREGTRTLSSRYARVEVNEGGSGSDKRYGVMVNNQPVLATDAQSAVIGTSETFDLGTQEAIIFTTYMPNDAACAYRSHILSLSNLGSRVFDIDSCVRNYQARVQNGSLLVTFSGADAGNAVGTIWRFEGDDLERL